VGAATGSPLGGAVAISRMGFEVDIRVGVRLGPPVGRAVGDPVGGGTVP
jgi:hypothetical protein